MWSSTMLGVEPLRVPAHALHQLRALQMLDIARPIVHIRGGHELAALFQPGDQEGRTIGAGRVDCGGISGGTRPQDD